ncbi:class I SAM-dependent methyltransferase [Plantibacter flavus]|uniref:SAM-dependent methyltransferase n=1 Tax=Plantibacter flavus TaxID=150123 RepID=UPI003F1767F8
MTTAHRHPHHEPAITDERAITDPAAFWEDRYSSRGQVWSGRPNAALEREVTGLTPGTALELGSGEGADAIWLAQQGWQVTAVDISPSALALGASIAERAGVAERITWVQADLVDWQPEGTYDLVTSAFLHSPVEFARETVLQRTAAAVAPGGVLLVVGHGGPPPWAPAEHIGHATFPTPEEVHASLELDPTAWDVLTSGVIARAAIGPDGEPAELDDSVLKLRRR